MCFGRNGVKVHVYWGLSDLSKSYLNLSELCCLDDGRDYNSVRAVLEFRNQSLQVNEISLEQVLELNKLLYEAGLNRELFWYQMAPIVLGKFNVLPLILKN